MNKLFSVLLILLFPLITINAQKTSDKEDYTILLTGASFASENNGWFELGTKFLNAKPINRAIGGEAVVDAANRMAQGTLYSAEELEEIDALVIMHVHERNVASLNGLKEDYTEYRTPFDRSNYAAAYDYVIKRYLTECYNLKFNEKSKYYNTPFGKPAIIVLSTHWNDSRVIYNQAIRELGARWGFPVIEFDKYVGFSNGKQHPVTKKAMSQLYTNGNNETMHNVEHGWHPENGQDKYIQQRMAAIYVDAMKRILPLKP